MMVLTWTNGQVETSDAKEMTNPVRFGQDFIGRVANPRDILQYYRRKKATEKSKSALMAVPPRSNSADIRKQECARRTR